MSLTVLVVDLGFLLFLTVFGAVVSVFTFTTKLTGDKEPNFHRIILRMIIVISCVIIGIIEIMIFVDLLTDASYKTEKDISNWITLTVEIGVGIVIGILIMMYSHYRGDIATDRIISETTSPGYTFPSPTFEPYVFGQPGGEYGIATVDDVLRRYGEENENDTTKNNSMTETDDSDE